MLRKSNRTFTDEQFIQAIKESFSIAQVLKKLNLEVSGANYKGFKKLQRNLNCDISHFTGQGHLKGKTHRWNTKIDLKEILVENSEYLSTHSLKSRLLKDNLLEYKCYICSIKNWLDKPLSLHIDHINGINTDNRLENLRLLCPNCHSQTETFAGKNKKKKVKFLKPKKEKIIISKFCLDCKIKISQHRTRCKVCAGFINSKTKIQWPLLEDLIKMVEETSYLATGKLLGVSDNAVRQHIKRYKNLENRIIENNKI